MSTPLEVENTVDLQPTQTQLYVDCESHDPLEKGTVDYPFSHIQDAIAVAPSGSTILVAPGRYRERLDFLGKSLYLTGIDLADPEPNDLPILDCNYFGPGLCFTHAEDSNCVVDGFELTGGGTVVQCKGARLRLIHCLIVGNDVEDPNVAVIQCTDSNIVLVQCTVVDNLGVVSSLANSSLSLWNSIYWEEFQESLVLDSQSILSLDHCDSVETWPGRGNFSEDPLFVHPGQWLDGGEAGGGWLRGDYHLKSSFGRWNEILEQWEVDAMTSPCIGAGDPNVWLDQGYDSGENVNCGVYGGTLMACKGQSL